MSVDHNKVHSHGNVPFSWENKPGVCKNAPTEEDTDHAAVLKALPPPPCPSEAARVSIQHRDLQILLPPCAFQPPPSRSSSQRGLKKQDDPFLIAYKECTKTTRKGGNKGRRNMSIFSCKKSCSVRYDSIVRISQLPISRSQRESERKRDGSFCEP